MGVVFPVETSDESTVELKLIHKGLAYLISGGNNAGERHEVSTIYKALTGSFQINGIPFAVPGAKYFSRSGYTPTGDFSPKVTKSHLDKFLPKCFYQDSKLLGGFNEVDGLMYASDKRTKAWAFVECKSGSASSSGSQTASYMQVCLEMAEQHPSDTIYFAHCYYSESGGPSAAYVFNCLSTIKNSCIGLIRDSGVRAYLGSAPADGSSSPGSMDTFIQHYNTQRNAALAVGDASSRLASLQSIIKTLFRIVIADTCVAAETDADVKKKVGKLVRDNYCAPGVKGFWPNLANELDPQ